MNAVRYYSKSGNTKKIAEAIAEGIGAKAISITYRNMDLMTTEMCRNGRIS